MFSKAMLSEEFRPFTFEVIIDKDFHVVMLFCFVNLLFLAFLCSFLSENQPLLAQGNKCLWCWLVGRWAAWKRCPGSSASSVFKSQPAFCVGTSSGKVPTFLLSNSLNPSVSSSFQPSFLQNLPWRGNSGTAAFVWWGRCPKGFIKPAKEKLSSSEAVAHVLDFLCLLCCLCPRDQSSSFAVFRVHRRPSLWC